MTTATQDASKHQPSVPPRTRRIRDWAYYVQLFGLMGFWGFVLSICAWFVWRVLQLRALGDVWVPAAVIGAVLGPVFILLASIVTYVFTKMGNDAEPALEQPLAPDEEVVIAPMINPWSWKFRLLVGVLAAITLWGGYAWSCQLRYGLGVTGLGRPVFWGLYITDFVFFIGISHAGTLISAILRIAQAEWRRAITRSAEVITVLVLVFGASNIFLDLGRFDRMFNMFIYGRIQSPLLWDMCSITSYLTGSTIYLYLPLIPDIAILRSRSKGWRRHLYHLLSFGWNGSPKQVHALEKAIAIMAIMVIPIAVSVHTVVSWVFSMTLQPMWHSAIFGPYFVVGAIFSGIAALLLAMAILRRVYHLEDYLRPVHFNFLGMLLLVMACLWFYFTFAEYLTAFYGGEPTDLAVFHSKFNGRFSLPFWTMIVTCFVVPFAILCRGKTRTIAGCCVASVCICIGMWLERYVIIVPTLTRPRTPLLPEGHYTPSWVELSLLCGFFSGFFLLYAVFTRMFPIISIWEIREGRETAADVGAERVRGYFPSNPPHGESAKSEATP